MDKTGFIEALCLQLQEVSWAVYHMSPSNLHSQIHPQKSWTKYMEQIASDRCVWTASLQIADHTLKILASWSSEGPEQTGGSTHTSTFLQCGNTSFLSRRKGEDSA